MEPGGPHYFEEQHAHEIDEEETLELPAFEAIQRTGTIVKERIEEDDTLKVNRISTRDSFDELELNPDLVVEPVEEIPAKRDKSISELDTLADIPGVKGQFTSFKQSIVDGMKASLHWISAPGNAISLSYSSSTSPSVPRQTTMARGKALLFAALLVILLLNAFNSTQFLGPQGWAYVLGGSGNTSNSKLLQSINQQLHLATGNRSNLTTETPQQYIDFIMQKMTLEQKLGQMMLVQFVGPSYSLDLSTMVNQFNVGAVLIFAANGNIMDKAQLKDLISQMQSNSPIPLAVAIDQEGGTVDRLQSLDGPRPAAAQLGATSDPNKALAEGLQDAKDLSYYGINLNLAPVVDVTNIYNSQLVGRTFGNTPGLVEQMAAAYLQGLQQSGHVLGTLKHFPGLGDVADDPHSTVPNLYRSEQDLEAIDWAPYRTLIQQGNVHAIMVTHEIVHAIDSTKPSSLSSKIVNGILRNKFGFQGVIMTDSLTMEGITAYYSPGQAAALAIEAGSDLLMGASTAADVANMIQGIKQAINNGEITQKRIDDSVRRILLLKYEMGLLPIPTS